MRFLSVLHVALFSSFHGAVLSHLHSREEQAPIGDPTLSINGIPFSTRAYWMRQANVALGQPCPYAAFGTVIVNHTGTSELGELVCTGANNRTLTGNPTLHGKLSPPYYT